MPRKKTASFEENLAQLEEVVGRLESSGASLDDIMADYTRGIQLSNLCMASLQKAEKQIDVLLQEQGQEVQEQELQIEGDI